MPIGTIIKEGSNVVADLNRHGEEYVAAYGGTGGKGNRFFLANDNRAPTTVTLGELGQERFLHLELKTVAHAGMVSVLVCFSTGYLMLKNQTFRFSQECWNMGGLKNALLGKELTKT